MLWAKPPMTTQIKHHPIKPIACTKKCNYKNYMYKIFIHTLIIPFGLAIKNNID